MIRISPRTGKTSFEIDLPEPDAVSLVGDFNNWNPEANPMKKQKSGVWKVQKELPTGRYEFLYFTSSGRWIPDPDAPRVNNDYGTQNSVVEVPVRKSGSRAGKRSAK